MTQQEALEELKHRYPDSADDIFIQRMRSIGKQFGHTDSFTIYVAKGHDCEIIGSSEHSWEHALSIIEPDRIKAHAEADHSEVEEAAL